MTHSRNEILTALLLANQPTHPYVITPEMLLKSTNPYLAEIRLENPSSTHFILTHPEANNLTQLKNDMQRDLVIESQSFLGKELTEDSIPALLEKNFGREAADNIIRHYNQLPTYMIKQPLIASIQDGNIAHDAMTLRQPDKMMQRISKVNGNAVRESAVDYFYLKVPQDPAYILPDQFRSIFADKQQKLNANARENKIQNIEGYWKLKLSLNIFAVATKEGFDILGMGTDNLLAVNMIMNQGNPREQLLSVIEAVMKVQTNIDDKLKDIKNKQIDLTGPKKESADNKAKELSEVIAEIGSFKNGKITFAELITNVEKHYQKSLERKREGFFGKNFPSLYESPTAKVIGGCYQILKAVNDKIAKIAYQALKIIPEKTPTTEEKPTDSINQNNKPHLG